jgi:nickel-type superoxide dismutase maturation protease
MRPRALIWVFVAIAAVAAARRWLDVVEVRGKSMVPTLLPGDRLLVVRARARVGDVVLALDPHRPDRELVKRVASLDATGLDLHGDNASASTDVRVAPGAANWRAVVRYWPPVRFGLVSREDVPLRVETHVQPSG